MLEQPALYFALLPLKSSLESSESVDDMAKVMRKAALGLLGILLAPSGSATVMRFPLRSIAVSANPFSGSHVSSLPTHRALSRYSTSVRDTTNSLSLGRALALM